MPDVEIIIGESDYPSITEMTDIMDGVEDPIKLDWSNTRDEVATIRRYPKNKFVLHVRDFAMRDRTVATLGLPLKIENDVSTKAWNLLVQPKEYDWRNFVKQNEKGPSTRNILLKLAADSLRRGNRPAIAELIEPLFIGGISILDVDVLLRLKGRQR